LKVTLYTRQDCRLCDEAEDLLRSTARLIQFGLDVVSIDDDPALHGRLGDRVPVVYIDGKEVASAPIDEARLRAVLSS
jgi:glutaredoxin